MQKYSRNLTCPTCGYDLTGIIREDGISTCPECCSVSDSLRYSLPLNRWPTIYRLVIGHIVLMVLMSSICFLPLGGGGLLIWFVLQLFILPCGVVLTERKLRQSNPPRSCTPSLPVLSFIVACYTITLLILGFIVASVIAYSTM